MNYDWKLTPEEVQARVKAAESLIEQIEVARDSAARRGELDKAQGMHQVIKNLEKKVEDLEEGKHS